MRFGFGLGACLLAGLAPIPALAQEQPTAGSDVIIMRKVIVSPNEVRPQPGGETPDPTPTPTPTGPAAWEYGAYSAVEPSCGDVVQTRSVSCTAGGAAAPNSYCESQIGAHEPLSRTVRNTEACPGAWVPGEWSSWSSSCSSKATRTRQITCQVEGAEVDASRCTGSRPQAEETSGNYSGCEFSWERSEWSACSNNQRTRTVQCVATSQSGDKYNLEDAHCSSVGARPPVLQPNCSLISNGSFEDGLHGWEVIGPVSIGNGPGGPEAVALARPSPFTYLIDYFPVVAGRTYTLRVDVRGGTTGRCTKGSGVSPVSVWRKPNGINQPSVNSFVFSAFQICNLNLYQRVHTFTADYTGQAQLVLWGETDPGVQMAISFDNVSVIEN